MKHSIISFFRELNMKKVFFSFLLLFSNIYVLASPQDQPQLDDQQLNTIIEKMKNNDSLSSDEQQTFDSAINFVKGKIHKAGGKKTTLTTTEAKVIDQDALNQIKPSISDILESGKKYKWGLDLALVEERGASTRKNGVGGEDLASYISTFQKVKTTPNDPKYAAALNKIMRITKLSREQIESIPLIGSKPLIQFKPDLDKAMIEMTRSATTCKCLAGLIEPHAKLFPAKTSVFTRARYGQSEVYDQANTMKINANVAMTQVNKEMDTLEQNSQVLPTQVSTFQQKVQDAAHKLGSDCFKRFTTISNEITKLSSNKIVVNNASCNRQ